ncbi:MAG: radical SAM protein [Desulfobacterales bacterium]|nr:radical SAM protein [Desulfobacterales bacterium]
MANAYVEMGLSAPVNVTWEVTYGCNLACVHCLSDSGRQREGELDTQQCRRVIDHLADQKVFQFNIGGGEPLMRPDFLDLMDYAHEKGMVTCISTNGTLIDEAVAARLDHKLVYIQVSLDGASPASNDPIRGAGSFSKAMRALEHLRRRDIEVSINTVLTRLSFPELDRLVALAAEFGAKLRVSRFRPSGRGKRSWLQLNVSREQMTAFSQWLSRAPGGFHGRFLLFGFDRRTPPTGAEHVRGRQADLLHLSRGLRLSLRLPAGPRIRRREAAGGGLLRKIWHSAARV